MCRVLGQLSHIQQQLVQPGHNRTVSGTAEDQSLSAQVDRLGICFVIATVQVETAARLLKVRIAPAVIRSYTSFMLFCSRMCQLLVCICNVMRLVGFVTLWCYLMLLLLHEGCVHTRWLNGALSDAAGSL